MITPGPHTVKELLTAAGLTLDQISDMRSVKLGGLLVQDPDAIIVVPEAGDPIVIAYQGEEKARLEVGYGERTVGGTS